MANPQKEDGYTAIANALIEAIIATPLGGGQTRLLLHLLRKSYGYNRKTASISGSEFAEATKLHPKVVARELRELESKSVIVVFREEGKTSTYGIQKNFDIWLTGNQNVPGCDPEPESTRNQKVPPPGTETLPHPEPKGSRSIYKELKDNSKDKKDTTEPDGSGTLRARFSQEWRDATNKGAIIGKYFQLLLGQNPDIGRLGGMGSKKRLNSAGRLFDLMLEASRTDIIGDAHDYLEKLVQRELAKEAGHAVTQGRSGQNGRKAGYGDRRLKVGTAGSHGPGGHDSWADKD